MYEPQAILSGLLRKTACSVEEDAHSRDGCLRKEEALLSRDAGVVGRPWLGCGGGDLLSASLKTEELYF